MLITSFEVCILEIRTNQESQTLRFIVKHTGKMRDEMDDESVFFVPFFVMRFITEHTTTGHSLNTIL